MMSKRELWKPYLIALALVLLPAAGILLGQGAALYLGTGDNRPVEIGADGVPYMRVAPGGTITALNSATLSGFTASSSILSSPTINGSIAGTFDDFTAYTFSAGNFTASAGDWTVADGDETVAYARISTNLLLMRVTVNTSTVSATPQGLRLTLPASLTCQTADQYVAAYQANDNGTSKTGIAICPANQTYLEFRLENEGNWATATDTTYVRGTFLIAVS